jgi:hypothetical protein
VTRVAPVDAKRTAQPVRAASSGATVRRKDGERGRNRTYNLLIKSQLLCQLSYAPEPFAFIDLWEVDRAGFFGTFTKLSPLPLNSSRRIAFVTSSVETMW